MLILVAVALALTLVDSVALAAVRRLGSDSRVVGVCTRALGHRDGLLGSRNHDGRRLPFSRGVNRRPGNMPKPFAARASNAANWASRAANRASSRAENWLVPIERGRRQPCCRGCGWDSVEHFRVVAWPPRLPPFLAAGRVPVLACSMHPARSYRSEPYLVSEWS